MQFVKNNFITTRYSRTSRGADNSSSRTYFITNFSNRSIPCGVSSNLGNIICFNLLVYSEYCSKRHFGSLWLPKGLMRISNIMRLFFTLFNHCALTTFLHRNASTMQPKPHTWMQETRHTKRRRKPSENSAICAAEEPESELAENTKVAFSPVVF